MEDMRCVYQALLKASAPAVAPLAERFAQRIRQARLSAPEAAELILTYVQALPYRIPQEEPFGVLPPALVSAQGWGDCDSKALLALLLLERVGVRSVLLTAPTLHHAAVGVALPGPGLSLRHGALEFRYAEVTSSGWPIGMVPPMHDVPRAWKVVPLDGSG
jgi:hypothetical protein